jgi:predicted nucleic-acid-binding protein
VDRKSIAGAIGPLLVLPGVVAEEQEILTASVRLYGKVKQGFADCYLAAAAGVEDAQVVTFDADLRKLAGARGLDPMETW